MGARARPVHVTAPGSHPCVGAIIAGGRASRMGGGPKGLERIGGRRILDRVASALAQVTDGLLLVANAPGAAAWLPGVATVPDDEPDAGPLGGIATALAHAGAPILAVAWDMPFVPASLLGELRRVAEAAGADAAAAERDAAGRVEPLCAYYAPSCRVAAARRIARGELRVAGLLEDVRAERLPLARVLDWGDPERLFLNVNTPAELDAARRLVPADPREPPPP